MLGKSIAKAGHALQTAHGRNAPRGAVIAHYKDSQEILGRAERARKRLEDGKVHKDMASAMVQVFAPWEEVTELGQKITDIQGRMVTKDEVAKLATKEDIKALVGKKDGLPPWSMAAGVALGMVVMAIIDGFKAGK